MAFDPIQEDCLRLILGSMKREHVYPLENGPYVNSRIKLFHENPDALIANDADRAFHLIARATEQLDYQLPFVLDDAEADTMTEAVEALLEEASSLDPDNWDARRMLAAVRLPSVDEYYRYLDEHADEVFSSYAAAVEGASDAYAREYASDLARRPYLRWMAALASKALIAGHYTRALEAAERSLSIAPDDPADIRLTAMYAAAKLERGADEIDRLDAPATFMFPGRPGMRAWGILARIALAYKGLDMQAADRAVDELFEAYAGTAYVLYNQTEFPDGTFARVNVQPGSDDELALAVSEATPLLQEGAGAPDSASLAAWLAEHPRVRLEMERANGARRRIAPRKRGPEDEN